MVACARAELADPRKVEVFHIWNRVVRRAWLCGDDPYTEKNYDYRRDWITDRERLLAQLFGIDVAFHAELSNHIHLVLRTRPDIVRTWSDEEVIRRWLSITKLTRNFEDVIVPPDDARVRMKAADAKYVADVRLRLSSISYFMGALSEYVARRANDEDGVSGKFWEARSGCRKCTDDAAVIVCGIYVDLNQIRAGEASTPQESTHTSAFDRIDPLTGKQTEPNAATEPSAADDSPQPARDSWLCPLTFAEGPNAPVLDGIGSTTAWRASDKGIIPLSLEQYLQLLDFTGRQLRADKPGAIPNDLRSMLEQLHIHPDRWLDLVNSLDSGFRRALGRLESLIQAAVAAGRRWLQGVGQAAELFT